MVKEVFELISKIKTIKKQTLIVDDDDERIIKLFYNDVREYLSYKLWKKIVINYSIDTMGDIFDSCVILEEVIIKKYKK